METAVKNLQITDRDVTYYLRDTDASLVAAWQEEFKQHQDHIKVCKQFAFKKFVKLIIYNVIIMNHRKC